MAFIAVRFFSLERSAQALMLFTYSLSGQVSKLSKLSDRLLAINALNKGLKKNADHCEPSIFQKWARMEIEKALTSKLVGVSCKSAYDGDTLGALVEHEPPEVILNT